MEFQMASQDVSDTQIGRTHSRAIYTEVAERLLTGNSGQLSPRLLRLTKQLDSTASDDAAFKNQIEVGPR
jgi:hypothetical protein